MKRVCVRRLKNSAFRINLRFWLASLAFAAPFVFSTTQAQSPPLAHPPSVLVAQAVQSPNLPADHVKAALPQLEQLTQALMAQTGVPGVAIAVVHQDQVVYLKGFGVREAGQTDPVDPDTIFQLASVSKPIAATVVAGVVGDRVVKWHDPIIKHMPDFQMDRPEITHQVTIQDMFSHRSGLPEHAGDDLEDLGFDRATILHRLHNLPTENRFRSVYAYTNFGLTAAAEAVAKATGKSWETLSAERLYQPLGMSRTSSRYADFARADNRALGHVLIDGQWVAKYRRNPDAQSPAGGVSSTVRDMVQWMRLQLGNGTFEGQPVIDSAALAAIHTPQMVSRPATESKYRPGQLLWTGMRRLIY